MNDKEYIGDFVFILFVNIIKTRTQIKSMSAGVVLKGGTYFITLSPLSPSFMTTKDQLEALLTEIKLNITGSFDYFVEAHAFREQVRGAQTLDKELIYRLSQWMHYIYKQDFTYDVEEADEDEYNKVGVDVTDRTKYMPLDMWWSRFETIRVAVASMLQTKDETWR